jgi:hypothetical protein
MRLTVRNLVISLLILAQSVALWQGAVAAAQLIPQSVNQTNLLAQHQTPVLDQTRLHASTTSIDFDNQLDCCCCCDNCSDCDDYNSCGCNSMALVSSSLTIRLCQWKLNHSAFPSFLDGFFTPPTKPPRMQTL